MDAMIERLESILKQFNDLSDELMDPNVFSDAKRFARLGKEQASLKKIVDAYLAYKDVDATLKDAYMLLNEDDKEMVELAKTEIEEFEPKKVQMLEDLRMLLLPKDPADDNDAIIEIRGAAGGDEGNIFAGDLYRMYTRYCENRGFKVELLEADEGEAGGFSLISCSVRGLGAYGELKFESGAHRVQRVPKTETQGRIHTSTATVLVLSDDEDVEFEINPADLTFETHRASGAGGQHVNKTDSAVRITHIPTGISVNCQDGRSQHDNRDKAMRLIKVRLYDDYKRKIEAEKGKVRMSKIGTGDRSEKIRTYNYPQNRVTDHRIGLTIQQLDRIMEGKLDDIIKALFDEDQRLKIAGEQN